jgi:hypothetical protein
MSILNYEHAHAGKVSEQDAKSYLAWGRPTWTTLMGAFVLHLLPIQPRSIQQAGVPAWTWSESGVNSR